MTSALVTALVLLIGLFIGLFLGYTFGKSKNSHTDQALALAELRSQLDKVQSDYDNYRENNTDAKVLQTELKSMKESVENLRSQSSSAHNQRTEAETALKTLIFEIQKTTDSQKDETSKIALALTGSQTRGKFGEAKLELLLELSGLKKGINYVAQESTTDADSSGIPDVTIFMPGDTRIFIDSKFPFRDFYNALESSDDSTRDEILASHAEKLRGHITALSRRKYQVSEASPDFVVLFLPFEPLLAEAQRIDSKLQDFAFEKQIILATPSTMLALLHSIALVFRRAELSESAHDIKEVAKKFLNDITSLHLKIVNLGKAVNKLNEAYGEVIPTAESTVLTPARKISTLGISGDPASLKIEYPDAPFDVRQLRVAESAEDFSSIESQE